MELLVSASANRTPSRDFNVSATFSTPKRKVDKSLEHITEGSYSEQDTCTSSLKRIRRASPVFPTPSKLYGDRFIPNRATMSRDRDLALVLTPKGPGSASGSRARRGSHSGSSNHSNSNTQWHSEDEYRCRLEDALFSTDHHSSSVLSFKRKSDCVAVTNSDTELSQLLAKRRLFPPESKRQVSSTAERMLDAPHLVDDFYLNLMDWSQNYVLAVALFKSVYLWAPEGGITKLLQLPETEEERLNLSSVSYVSSVKCSPSSHHTLAVGTSFNEVQLWDAQRQRKLRSFRGHSQRVGALDWNPTHPSLLSSGGRDATIFNYDVRTPRGVIGKFIGHEQEICGLKWSPEGHQLASGANDNLCCIWDMSNLAPALASVAATAAASEERPLRALTVPQFQPRHRLQDSTAAVKALAWCPYQRGLLAVGGGTADKHIRMYNTTTGEMQHAVNTGSQVCALLWNQEYRELVSGHGFSQNQLTVWKAADMTKVAELTGHSKRVLFMCASPDGQTVVSAGGDETIRFWRVWEKKKKSVDVLSAVDRKQSPRSSPKVSQRRPTVSSRYNLLLR